MFMADDTASQALFFVGGLFMLAVVPGVIAVIEAFVLFLIRWNAFERSFRASATANGITGVTGIVLLFAAPKLSRHEVAYFLGSLPPKTRHAGADGAVVTP